LILEVKVGQKLKRSVLLPHYHTNEEPSGRSRPTQVETRSRSRSHSVEERDLILEVVRLIKRAMTRFPVVVGLVAYSRFRLSLFDQALGQSRSGL